MTRHTVRLVTSTGARTYCHTDIHPRYAKKWKLKPGDPVGLGPPCQRCDRLRALQP